MTSPPVRGKVQRASGCASARDTRGSMYGSHGAGSTRKKREQSAGTSIATSGQPTHPLGCVHILPVKHLSFTVRRWVEFIHHACRINPQGYCAVNSPLGTRVITCMIAVDGEDGNDPNQAGRHLAVLDAFLAPALANIAYAWKRRDRRSHTRRQCIAGGVE